MVCQTDPLTGNMLGKFEASTKGISSISVSPDGDVIATAAGQLKTFGSSDHKKMQKFSGHLGAVRYLIFSKDGKNILSSAVGERYIAVWIVGGSKKQSAGAVLAMDHSAVFLDSRCVNGEGDDNAGIYLLAVLGSGICYFWFGQKIEQLRNAKPTKILISSEEISSNNYKGALPTIFAAILQGPAEPASRQVYVAYGSLVKPSFQKILVHYGTDVKLNSSSDGVLLPMTQSLMKSKKGRDAKAGVVALDHANAVDALLPIPKVFEGKNRNKTLSVNTDERMRDLVDSRSHDGLAKSKDDIVVMEVDTEATTGITKAVVLSKGPTNAYKLLGVFAAMWHTGLCGGKNVMPWIYSILVNHSRHLMLEEPLTQKLNSLIKVCKSRAAAIEPLLQLSSRLQLVTAQINKATHPEKPLVREENQIDESSEEDDDKVDDVLYKEEDDDS